MISSDPHLPSVLLVRGAPRTGTSIVTELLNQSPSVAIISEYSLAKLADDLDPIFGYERTYQGMLIDAGLAELDERGELRVGPTLPNGADYYWRGSGQLPPPTFPTRSRRATILAAVAAASLGKQKVRVIGSKTPGTATEGDREALAGLFPALRYLFVVRNPYDVINSSINRRNRARANLDSWHVDDVDTVIDEYRANMRYLRGHIERYGNDCFVLTYEDLVERYAEVRGPLSEFLGVQLPRKPAVLWKEEPPPIVLTPDEEARVRAAFGNVIDGWSETIRTGPGAAAIAQLPSFADTVTPGIDYRYETGTPRLLGLGWHERDGAGVWSRGPEADLMFAVPAPGAYIVRAELTAFGPAIGRATTITLRLGERELLRVPAGAGGNAVITPAVAMVAKRTYRLTFATDVTASPAETGFSADPRTLGLCLRSVTFAAKT